MEDELYEQVVRKKEYRDFPEDFVRRIIKRNINKRDVVKETRKSLREIRLMYKGIRKKEDAEKVWDFLKKELPSGKVSVLDLGCGDFPIYLPQDEEGFEVTRYVAVDISMEAGKSLPEKVNFFVDDLLEPKEKWVRDKYSLCLLLNVIPVVEKIRNGSGKELLDLAEKISEYTLVSFPLYSLGGRKYIGHYWKKWCKEQIDQRKVVSEFQDRELFILLGHAPAGI
jgi:hypothetical protein